MAQETQKEKRVRRFRIGWYAVPGLALLALTAWLLINMAQASGGALASVLLGIVVVLGAAAGLFRAIDRASGVH